MDASDACWVIFHDFLSSADFFQNQFFLKILSGIPPECQTVWIQIRPDILSGLVWVKTVCKSYQQTTLVDKELWMNLLIELTFSGFSFNQLDLPAYETYDKLRHMLLLAINECSEGFGLA